MTRLAALATLAAFLGVAACSPGAEGRVMDVDGAPQAGCVVGASRLFDVAGRRVADADPVLTRSDHDGRWSLEGLAPGTHLLFAWQPATGSEVPGTGELIAMARAFAKGIVPESGRYARSLTEWQRNTMTVGVDLELGLYAGEGFHLAGHLSGPLLADRLDYVVSASVMRGELTEATDDGFSYHGPGRLMRTSDFLATADERGHFDLGWVLGGDLVNVSVSAVPSQCVQLARFSLKLEHDLTDAEVEIPRHEVRRLRVPNADAFAKGHQRPCVRFWEPGRSSGGGPVGPDGELDVVVQTGGMLFQATAAGYASSFVAREPSDNGVNGETVLDLLPEPHNEVTLVDESGQPIVGAWIFIGTEDTADFLDPFPLFSVTDAAGQLAHIALPAGKYPAQLVHEKGSYDEWRVDFEIDVKASQNTVTVPLSAKYPAR